MFQYGQREPDGPTADDNTRTEDRTRFASQVGRIMGNRDFANKVRLLAGQAKDLSELFRNDRG
jgi:hypothetical protein